MIRLEGMECIVPTFLKTASTGKFISSSTKVFCEIPVIRGMLGKAVTDFIDKKHFTIGSYILSYRDGSEAEIPVVYGQNICSLNVSWKRELESEFTMYSSDKRLMEVSYTTCPVHDNRSSWYRYICKNPNPSSSLTGIRIKCTKTGSHILLRNIRLTDRVMKPEWLE